MKCLTKVIATVGPACEDRKIIKKMILAGVSVFRFNLKHNDLKWHKEVINTIRKESKKMAREVGIMLDLQGPELRLLTKEGKMLEIKKGDEVFLGDVFVSDKKSLVLSKKDVTKSIKIGQKIYIDSGLYEFKVGFSKKGLVVLKAMQDGTIFNGKSVATPGFENNLPALTKDDFSNLAYFSKLKIDYVCLSFCRSANDVKKLKEVLKLDKMKSSIISKIECRSALNNLDEIIKESDGVMIARGDLGVEVPIREISFWQKEIVGRCRILNKPVMVATQMMESMIERNRPTRAEVSDVANAVFDGADCLMLSGETAMGKYPVLVVKQMRSICQFSETKRPIDDLIKNRDNVGDLVVDSVRNLVANSGEITMNKILVFSKSGKTARKISSFRLGIPLIGVTDARHVYKDMFLSYATVPYYKKFGRGRFDVRGEIISELISKKFLLLGDRVIVVHGQNWLVSSSTNEVGVFEV